VGLTITLPVCNNEAMSNHAERIDTIRASLPVVEARPDVWAWEPDYDGSSYMPYVPADVDLLPGEKFARGIDNADRLGTIAKVAGLARRCERHGLPAPVVESRVNGDGTYDVLITGLGVKLDGGWHVIAAVDHATDGMAAVAPGAPDGTFAKWTGADSNCESCGKNIKRTHTVVVRNEDGDEKQLGGQCATAFLGVDAAIVWSLVEGLDELMMDEEGGGGGMQVMNPQVVVSVAVAVARIEGWLSKGKANECGGIPTADLVEWYLFGRGNSDAELRKHVQENYDRSTEAHAAYMTGLMEWAATITGSDYLDAIRYMLTECEVVSLRRLGVLASVPAAYDREVARRLEQERKESGDIAPVPVTDKRVQVVGTVQSVKAVENEYGMTLKMVVAADEGYRLWGTVPSSVDVEAGDRVQFMAKVQPSRDDATFGFYSRPTKAEVLAA